MSTLRDNKDILRVCLETFIHDPLMEWAAKARSFRLLYAKPILYPLQDNLGSCSEYIQASRSGSEAIESDQIAINHVHLIESKLRGVIFTAKSLKILISVAASKEGGIADTSRPQFTSGASSVQSQVN